MPVVTEMSKECQKIVSRRSAIPTLTSWKEPPLTSRLTSGTTISCPRRLYDKHTTPGEIRCLGRKKVEVRLCPTLDGLHCSLCLRLAVFQCFVQPVKDDLVLV